MKPIVITVDENGKTTLTPEQLQVLIDDAYKQGYEDGYRAIVVTTPIYPSQPYYASPIITCNTGD